MPNDSFDAHPHPTPHASAPLSTPVRWLVASFMRALAGMLHPRMLWLTVLPFVGAALLWGTALWFLWSALVALVQSALGQFALSAPLFKVLTVLGWYGLHRVVAPFITITLLVPVIVATVLLLVAAGTMPAVVRHLGRRRYAAVQRLHGGSWYGSLGQALLASAVFLVVALLSLPLWLVPPLFAVIPPVLWGWLTYRVMSYDALAQHASVLERRTLLRRHRWPLLAIGVATGLLGSLPALLWVSSVAMIVLFPLIALLAIWLH
jgi:hypothetical protein